MAKRPMRWDLVIWFVIIATGGTVLASYMLRQPGVQVPVYTYKVINEYEHDKDAFTQGLIYEDGFLWETTGRYGTSTLRKVDLKTGDVLKKIDLDKKYFGEGMTLMNDKFYWLTYQENKAFVYDRDLKPVKEFEYEGEGWGLTHDGTNLIMSDGTPEIEFRDPETFEVVRKIWVRQGRLAVSQLNELEYIGGRIYANTYKSDYVYKINPESGAVEAVIDLTGLWSFMERPAGGEAVLNGIAINMETEKILVTGKLCPKVFELELVLKK